MSDDLNWNAIWIWASAVGFQAGTALYSAWKNYQHRRSIEETGYEKVQRGESIDGWELAISTDRIRKKHNESDATIVCPPWLNDDTELPSASRDGLDLLLNFLQSAPDGRVVYVLSRYSVIADIDTTIVRIIYATDLWSSMCTFYLTHRIVATLFPNRVTHRRYRVVLVDIVTKHHQMFTIESPFGAPIDASIIAVRRKGLSQNQMSVVYIAQVASPGGDTRWEFRDAIYEIPTGHIDVNFVVNAFSSEELSIPADGRHGYWGCSAGFPPIEVIYDDADDAPNAVDNALVVSFELGNWQITRFPNWMASFQSTLIGSRFANAVEAFGSLSPPESWPAVCALLQRFGMRYYSGICGYENGSAVYATHRLHDGGVMRRWIKPPSLKYLAAKAFCRANPNIDVSQLNDRVGFDVVEGMTSKNGDDEENASVITL